MEPIFDVPSQPAFTTFTTDFGVNFGTFICFESLWERAFELVQKVFITIQETPDVSLFGFQYPNVTDIVFPTAWVDEVPFLTAAQVKDNHEKLILLDIFNFTLQYCIQVQTSWAVTNNVNFLASGIHAPLKLGNTLSYLQHNNNILLRSPREWYFQSIRTFELHLQQQRRVKTCHCESSNKVKSLVCEFDVTIIIFGQRFIADDNSVFCQKLN